MCHSLRNKCSFSVFYGRETGVENTKIPPSPGTGRTIGYPRCLIIVYHHLSVCMILRIVLHMVSPQGCRFLVRASNPKINTYIDRRPPRHRQPQPTTREDTTILSVFFSLVKVAFSMFLIGRSSRLSFANRRGSSVARILFLPLLLLLPFELTHTNYHENNTSLNNNPSEMPSWVGESE